MSRAFFDSICGRGMVVRLLPARDDGDGGVARSTENQGTTWPHCSEGVLDSTGVPWVRLKRRACAQRM